MGSLRTLLLAIGFVLLYSGYSTQDSDVSGNGVPPAFMDGKANDQTKLDKDDPGSTIKTDDKTDTMSSSIAQATASSQASVPASNQQLPDIKGTTSDLQSKSALAGGLKTGGKLGGNIPDPAKEIKLASKIMSYYDFWKGSNPDSKFSPASFAKEFSKSFGMDNNWSKNLPKIFANAMGSFKDGSTIEDFSDLMSDAVNKTSKSFGFDDFNIYNNKIIRGMMSDAAETFIEKMSTNFPDIRTMDVEQAMKLISSLTPEDAIAFYTLLSNPMFSKLAYVMAGSYSDKIADSFNLNEYQTAIFRSALTGTVKAFGQGDSFLKAMDIFKDVSKAMKISNPDSDPPSGAGDIVAGAESPDIKGAIDGKI